MGALDRRVLDELGHVRAGRRAMPVARHQGRFRLEDRLMEGNDWIWPAIIVLAIFLWAVWTLRPMPPK